MQDTLPPRARLAEADTALSSLLDALLAEVPPYVPPPQPGRLEPAPAAAAADAAGLNPGPLGPLTPEDAGQAVLPAWADGPFRVLLFRIAGMSLAAPLVTLRAVTRLHEPPRRMPGQPSWHLGVCRYREQSLVVVDIGRLLGLGRDCPQPAYLLVIGDGGLAIACDGLGETPTTEPDSVRWRTRQDRQAWLAGVLPGQMCALLDPGVIAGQIGHG